MREDNYEDECPGCGETRCDGLCHDPQDDQSTAKEQSMSEHKQTIDPYIEIGHPMLGDVVSVPLGKTIRFIAEDGKCCLVVGARKRKGKPLTIEIRGSDNTVQDGVLYDTELTINPVVSNSILVTNALYH